VRLTAFSTIVGIVAATLLAGCGGGGGGGVAGDRQPPQIRQVQVFPDTLIATDSQVRVTVTAVDLETGLKEVVAEVTYPDGTSSEIRLTVKSGDEFEGTFTAQWNAAIVPLEDAERWVVQISVRATDNAGNTARSSPIAVRAVIMPPSLPPDF